MFKNAFWYNFLTAKEEFSLFHPQEFSSWSAMLGRQGPLIVELGCGKDDTLLKKAKDNPQEIYIGIEAHAKFLRYNAKKLIKLNLPNVCLANMDGFLALKHFFKSQEVSLFCMNFPDPWPKDKHHSRRLFQYLCFDLMIDRLEVGGRITIKSDVYDAVCIACKEFAKVVGVAGTNQNDIEIVPSNCYNTRFEKKYRIEGKDIFGGTWTKLFHNKQRKLSFMEKIGYV